MWGAAVEKHEGVSQEPGEREEEAKERDDGERAARVTEIVRRAVRHQVLLSGRARSYIRPGRAAILARQRSPRALILFSLGRHPAGAGARSFHSAASGHDLVVADHFSRTP